MRQNGEQHEVRPAYTPEGRQNQIIAAAIDLAEKQIREGTASSQVITHFLKLANPRERLELEVLEKQRDLLVAKKKSIESEERLAAMYEDAVRAMRSYSGNAGEENDSHLQ